MIENIEALVMLIFIIASIRLYSDKTPTIALHAVYFFCFGFIFHRFVGSEIWIAFWGGLTGKTG